MFSFLIPVYNTKKYLPKCMESVLQQTGAPFEVVLIDDGSTDGSGDMCDDYARHFPSVVRVIHKQNEGLLLTRRRGFKEAKGDWFICVDSDDYIASNLLQRVVETIESNPDSDLIIYNYLYEYPDRRMEKSKHPWHSRNFFTEEEKQILYEDKLLNNNNNMWMKALRRDIVDYDFDYSTLGLRNMGEDAAQTMALFTNAKRICYIDDPLYYYRKGEDSITGQQSVRKHDDLRALHNYCSQYLDIWDASQSVRNRFYNNWLKNEYNFLSWVYSSQPDEFADIVCKVSDTDTFRRAYNNGCFNELESIHLRISLPIACHCIKSKKIKQLRLLYQAEKALLSIRR